MRLFLAIDIPQKTESVILKHIEPIKSQHADARWVPAQNYHISLHHLGEVEDEKRYLDRIEEAVFDVPRFTMHTLSGGVFIDTKLTYYLDFYRAKPLELLVDNIYSVFDIQKDYKFIPHVTIAKAKIPSKQQYFHIKRKWEAMEFDHEFEVTELTLYQSIQVGDFPEFRVIKTFPLHEEA